MGKKHLFAVLAVLAVIAIAHLIGAAGYERPHEFRRAGDLDRSDCRVGVLAGYDSERVARAVLPHARIVGFSEFDDAFTALLAGSIEGFVYSEHVLNVALRAYPNRLKILDEPLASSPAVVLVSRKRPDLAVALNRFIRNYRRLGIYDDMFVRWCQSSRYVPMPAIPDASAAQGVIRVGTSGTEEPSSFWDDNGALTGFDIEFIRRFAQMMHMSCEIVCRPDGAILDELKAGRLDIVIDDYNAREAPGGVLVSDGYFDADTKVLVKRGDDSALMLGSTRLGYTRRLIRDPRIAVFLTGMLTTLSLTFVAALIGFALAFVWHRLALVLPRRVAQGADMALSTVRLLPPPAVMLALGCVVTTSWSAWAVAAFALALWLSSFLEPVIGSHPLVWLPVARVKLIELMQWTSVVGAVGVCDLTMAADLVCGRSLKALGPLVSVVAAYCLMNWLIQRAGEFLERKLG